MAYEPAENKGFHHVSFMFHPTNHPGNDGDVGNKQIFANKLKDTNPCPSKKT